MNILLTGANGFLGSEIKNNLQQEHSVSTLGRHQSTYLADLGTQTPVLPQAFECVIHCAGKAHTVPKTQQEREAFFNINFKGTGRLLDALETRALPKSFVFVSSVSVYGLESGLQVKETQTRNASDAYGRSKMEAEDLVQEWCAKHSVRCLILRLPLLAGSHPPGNLGAMIAGIKKGYYFNIGGGTARKSMVLTSDVADCILKAARVGGTYNLTDGYHPSFKELSALIAEQLNKQNALNLPLPVGRLLAVTGDIAGPAFPINSKKLNKILSPLTFDDTAARTAFNWNPTPVLKGFKID